MSPIEDAESNHSAKREVGHSESKSGSSTFREAKFIHKRKPTPPERTAPIYPDTTQGELEAPVIASGNYDLVQDSQAIAIQ
jgi:hypothetical protein